MIDQVKKSALQGLHTKKKKLPEMGKRKTLETVYQEKMRLLSNMYLKFLFFLDTSCTPTNINVLVRLFEVI